ncbi:DUF6011 domain-containing protein [Micromonospora sp. HM5-17]|nr:DUF6011 domain-containing protein [Micromonospora sp. HM5-17]
MPDEVAADQEPIGCEDCGRPLRTPKSRAERIGPKCGRRRREAAGTAVTA